jgi:hypothetical protein
MGNNHLITFRIGLVILGFPLLTFLMSFSAIAETKLTTIPERLTVAGTRGIDEVRTLVLKPAETTQNWKLTPIDLPRQDGLAVFPASFIHADPSSGAQIPGNDLVSIPIRFSLSDASASGQFSGNLLMRYNGGDIAIPLTLTIKDPPWIPLILIVAGVFAGLALSTYQAEGLDRDEVIVQIERLRVQMQADDDFRSAFSPNNNPFQNRINGLLTRVDTALADKKWEESRSLANATRALWDKWRSDKSEWLRLLKYKHEELDSRLDQELSTGIPYGKAVQHNLENAVIQLPEYDNPQRFGEKLQDIGQQIDQYLQCQQQIDRLSLLRNQMSKMQQAVESKKSFWNGKVVALREQLDYLLPTDKESFVAWKQEVDINLKQIIQEMEELEKMEASEEMEKRLFISTRDANITNSQKERVLDLPFISTRKLEERPEQAEKRIRWNRQALKWIAIISLTGIGFNQLYVSNTTFGANWFGDYFTLLAWGFGAEVSRESVTKVLQRFRLPGA